MPYMLYNKLEHFGDHFILALSGPELTQVDIEILTSLKPAGIFLDADNFLADLPYTEWLEALNQLIANSKKHTNRPKLIVALDHEGGRVQRTPLPITTLPYAQNYAEYSSDIAQLVATEIKSLGINLLFGPVADIDSNPANPVIGLRSFAKTAADVVKAIIPYTKTLIKHGIMPCAKHFPGHGETHQDSHHHLPTLDLTLDQLKQRELVPFCALIAQKIPFIMTSHILFPKLDPKFPATLSKIILNDLLRTDLGYQGVIISDDIDMKAISDNYSDQEIASLALNAGCEMFLFNHNPDRAITISEHLIRFYKAGNLNISILKSAKDRIQQTIKNQIQESTVYSLSQSIFEQHKKLIR